MQSIQLATSGVFPAITWDGVGRRWVSVWQSGDHLIFHDSRSVFIHGGETSFPRLFFRNKVLLSYRDGAPPYLGHLASVNSSINEIANLGVVHGMFPTVLGVDWVAYHYAGADAAWPVERRHLDTSQRTREGNGAPTGLALITAAGDVLTWDEVGTQGDLHNVTYAGSLWCGATDRNGKPCVVVRDPSTLKELVLWPGEDSQNPTMAWDGATGYAVVAWSAAGQGVRMITFDHSELVAPPDHVAREPRVVNPGVPRFFGWFYEDGHYGDADVPSNVAIMARSLFQNGDGQFPADMNERIIKAINDDGGGFIGPGDVRTVKHIWNKIFGMWVHEVGSPDDVRWACTDARAEMSREGVSVRPVVAVITEEQSLNSAYARSADIIAPEIYFRKPAKNWDEMYTLATQRITDVLAALAPSSVILIPQCYDRSDAAWISHSDQLTAIAQAHFDVLTNKRVLGLWPFSYSRPGGAIAYPETLRWYTAQNAVLVRPPYFVDTPPKPEPEPEPNPGDDMTEDDIRRWSGDIQDTPLFGAMQRYHNEVLARDRPLDGIIKSAENTDMWTGDVVTGGANAYLVRSMMGEYYIARSKGRTAEQALGDGYDAAIKSYRNGPAKDPQ